MMSYYFVKADLWGVPAGSVERFADHRAHALVADGKIERFDPENKRHVKARAEQDARMAKHQAEQEKKLEVERRVRAAREGRPVAG